MKTTSKSKKSAVCSLRSAVSPRRPRAAGFTLLELLIVIALIMVLMGLLIPAFYKVQDKTKAKKQDIERRIIESAIQAYKLQKKQLPVNDPTGVANDVVYGEAGGPQNSEVMDELKEADPPVLDVSKLRWENADGTGSVIDPYDEPYKITLDLNYDGKIGSEYKEYKVE